MKNLYMRRLVLTALMVGIICPALFADYTSKKNVTGNYEDPSMWSTQGNAKGSPPTNGNVDQALSIETGTIITRNGDFNPVTVMVNGKLIVKGNYTNNQWGGVTVKKDAVLEIFGNLTAAANITVEGGGTLIVHGNLTSSNAGITSHGDIIVSGNFSTASSTTVHNKGNLVVGGNFTHLGEGLKVNGDQSDTKIYILNPDAEIIAPTWSVVNNNPGVVGNLDDFLENEAGSLVDIVNNVIINVVIGYQWKTDADNSNWKLANNWIGNRIPTSTSNVRIKPCTGVFPEIKRKTA